MTMRFQLLGCDQSVRTMIRFQYSCVSIWRRASVGFVAALAATRSLRSLLFGVSAAEPLVFVTAAVLLGCVAVAASWIPARAATRADPLQAVRD
jgi:uncharacterized membrane protein